MADDNKPKEPQIRDSILNNALKPIMGEADPGTQSMDVIGTVLSALKKSQDLSTVRQLSFDVDPNKHLTNYTSIFKARNTVVPPELAKRIRDTEEMIGGVVLPHRARQISLFARPRPDRFDIGFVWNPTPLAQAELSKEEIEKLKKEKIPKLTEFFLNCGSNKNVKDSGKRTLSQFFIEIVEDLLTFGEFAVEIRRNNDKKLHSFRAIDAGTIYRIVPQQGEGQEAEALRRKAKQVLQELQGHKIDVARFEKDEFTWVQVIDYRPVQVFTDDELVVMQMAPSTDINRCGYPVSPIERIVTAITTHINLTTHNKLYFINGRAARNIMVFKSNNLNSQDLEMIKAQMQAHINSVNSAWRMPVFGMQQEDSVEIVPMDPGEQDMQFQYLADLNKRIIFAAYQMSPDEVAALSYLSRGTNSQSLSESNNEYKLVAARDVGLRPILLTVQDFLNERLLPRIDAEIAKYFRIDLSGLDAYSRESESSQLQQDAALHASFDDILQTVEKSLAPIGGKFPLNPQYLQLLERYFTKGEILKAYGGEKYKDADKDPNLAYYMADPVWLQLQQQKQQAEQMEQQQQQAAQQGQPQSGESQQDNQEQPQEGEASQEDLDSAIAQLGEALSKTENKLPATRKELLKAHKAAKAKIMKGFKEDSAKMIDEVMALIDGKDDGHEH
jgi:hypothetical protein